MTQARSFKMSDGIWNRLKKSGDAHKHRYGHAFIVSGPAGHGGAARLAARGALRVGAGVVTLMCPDDALLEHAAQLNAIMVKPFGVASDLREAIADAKLQAVCIGPNLGLTPHAASTVREVLEAGVACCLDADAITLVSDRANNLHLGSNDNRVMTPHEGELRRFIPEAFENTTCRISLAQLAADKAGCVVLFKGSDTIIAAPDTVPLIVSSKPYPHASWLATAGSGDVLAGFITGLLARQFDAFDAAAIAADLHLRCANLAGPGLISEDLPELLPTVFRQNGNP